MAVSSRSENFFQTTSSIAENERKQLKASNTQGSPVKFPTKILAAQVNYAFDQEGGVVFVAEAGGTVSGLQLATNEVSRLGRGSSAPLTSLAYHLTPPNSNDPTGRLDVFAGGWDKTITNYVLRQDQPNQPPVVADQVSWKAHEDFIKCLVICPIAADNTAILISGGADGDINFWTTTPEHTRIATLKPQCRGIESLALDPLSDPSAPILFFSTSQREIFQIALPPTLAAFSTLRNLSMTDPILAHETSVYKLHFDADGDLWTASADKTAKHLSRHEKWQADTILVHPDFVRDITTHDARGLVVTGCRDEEVRIWNSSTGDLLHVFTGHIEDVTALIVIPGKDLLLSASIDATLRRWSLAPDDLQKAIAEAKNPKLLEDNPEPKVGEGSLDFGLSAEEEAELKAMMDDEDEQVLEKMAMDEQ